MRPLFPVLILLLPAGCTEAVPPVGTILVYEVAPESLMDGIPVDMENVVSLLNRRINPRSLRRARIRTLGQQRIEIAVYGKDPNTVRRIERIVESAGTIEFRILANNRDHGPLIEQAKQLEAAQLTDAGGSLLAWWVPVASGRETDFASYSEIAARKRTFRGRQLTEILVVKDIFDVTGEYLRDARPGVDESGRLNVLFTFDRQGGTLFGGLTGNNLPDDTAGFARRLGIILDGYLQSAPAIRSAISQRGELTGDFTRQEVEDLVDVLNAGSLPVLLKKVEERPAADTP